jgi:HlyD family secretion protein
MNRNPILEISEITDSVEMLNENPRRLYTLFAVGLLIFLAVLILWCNVGTIDEYVDATGIVRPTENISSISGLVSGKITEWDMTEGAYVNKGDLLFKTDTTEYEQMLTSYEEQRTKSETEKRNLQKLQTSIETERNLFDKEISNESAYYYKYEKYISDLATIDEQYGNSDIDLSRANAETTANIESFNNQISDKKDELANLQRLKYSIEVSKNGFSGNSIYSQRYETYIHAVEKYDSDIAKAEKDTADAAELYKIGEISLDEYRTQQKNYDDLCVQKEKYVIDFMLAVSQEISDTEESIRNLENQLATITIPFHTVSQKEYDAALAKENLTLELRNSIFAELKALDTSLEEINKQIASLELNIKNASVTAPISGIVNLYTDRNVGDVIQAGADIATIVPETDGQFKLTAYIPSAEISEVEVGQEVKVRFTALPYQEYGEFYGTITKISSDARSTGNENTAGYYVGEVSMNLSGTDIELVSGMDCEIHVITKQKKIMTWILEKLDFIGE